MGDRWDVVTTMSGLPSFASEYATAKVMTLDDVEVRVLPLSRVIVSKRTANRMKDQAILHTLESTLQIIEELERASPDDAARKGER